MSVFYSTGSGGGGIDPDVLTAIPSDILPGKLAGVKGNEEPQWGTMQTMNGQTITPSLSNQNIDTINKYLTGNININPIPDQRSAGTKGLAITVNGSNVYYNIPIGYYINDGSGRSSTYMTAQEIINAMGIQTVVNFNVAQYSNLTLISTWALPSRGLWSGLRVMCKQDSYPNTPSEGIVFYEGNGTSSTKELAEGIWYFRAWNYITTNLGRYYGNYIDKTINNITTKGQEVFTSSTIYTIPLGVTSIDIFCIGGGSSGSFKTSNDPAVGGGGGGSGYTKTIKSLVVFPGQQLEISIGSGGIATEGKNDTAGNNGSDTYVLSNGSELIRAKGSVNTRGNNASGINGGSGGATGYGNSANTTRCNAGFDGSDAQAENGIYSDYFGIGQHTTTKAFEESTNTLYAGGGGGGGDKSGKAGEGGGGTGTHVSDNNWVQATSGTPNTGSGGGGGYLFFSGAGGSGICIIRWGY